MAGPLLFMRSMLRVCSRRPLQLPSQLFVVPKQNYYIVVGAEDPEDGANDSDDDEECDFLMDERDRGDEKDAVDYEVIEFASDPYPFYRKVINNAIDNSGHAIIVQIKLVTL